MRPLLLVMAACFTAASAAASSADDYPMRWRTFCDYHAGVSFRYPYDYFIPDQYAGRLVRDRAGGGEAMIGKQVEIDGKQVVVFEKLERRSSAADVRCVSKMASELPPDAVGKPLAEIAEQLIADGKAFTPHPHWEPYDYYSTAGRPQADKAWAPAGVEAVLGEGDGVTALVVKHGDWYSALTVAGKPSEHDNQRILDSFEVLVAKAKEQLTWREGQYRQGKVLDHEARVAKPDAAKAKVSWPRAWEVETKHYHITTDVSPKRLLEYGPYLEALYKAYSEVYDPDQIPPYKMEIHVFTTWRDFAGGAAANGIPVGPEVGGFFVPLLLSIFAFEETGDHFHSSTFALEGVLAHECSHQFLHCTCNGSEHVPTWLNEGLAVYFESGKFINGQFHIMSPTDRINRLKGAYAQTKTTLWPLGDYLEHYGHIDALQYGEVYAMTHFWIFGSDSGKKRFKLYWQALKTGEDGTKAFERIFMDDLIKAHGDRAGAIQAWQEKLIEYVQKRLR